MAISLLAAAPLCKPARSPAARPRRALKCERLVNQKIACRLATLHPNPLAPGTSFAPPPMETTDAFSVSAP